MEHVQKLLRILFYNKVNNMKKCDLLSLKTFKQAKFNFEQIKVLPTGGGPGAEHYDRYLMRCTDCGQYFIKEVIEWRQSDGNDTYSINCIPVAENEIEEVNKLNWVEILHRDVYINSGTGSPWRLIENKPLEQYYTQKIQKAIEFAIKVHQLDQNQTRKGKTVPYITHPLAVGIILSRLGADENIVAAGILHDVIEDSLENAKVTKKDIQDEFGETVANIVNNVTEQDKSLPWAVRKQKALEHITDMDHNSLLVKSADVLHNMKELLTDLRKDGVSVLAKFNAPREAQLERFKKLENALEASWSKNPLLSEIKSTLLKIQEFV